MTTITEAIILGIVQGITEWLPISSSGHLVLIQNLLGMEPSIAFDIMLHIGSLLVIFFVFWKDIFEIIHGVIRLDRKYLTLMMMYIAATIPIAVVGFFFRNQIESVFHDLRTVGFSLLFTSALLFFSRYPKKKTGSMSFRNAIGMGIAQSIAILPGVSRSGSTISAALMMGVKQEDAARFSFIMVIPAILGAAILELDGIGQMTDIGAMIAGTITTMIVGFFSLKLLLKIIKGNKFSYFGIYCFVLGLITLGIYYL